MSATSFTFEPVFLGLAAAAALAYAWSARKERPPAWRVALFTTGLLLIAASLNSPLETIAAKRLLLVHLLQNALIADIAPPLILLMLIPLRAAHLPSHLLSLGFGSATQMRHLGVETSSRRPAGAGKWPL